jgi:hypothetical protein
MKKVIFTLLTFGMMYGANAQYCGSFASPTPPFGTPSGPSQCTPSGDLNKPGISVSDSLPPVVNGTQANTTIQFKNFDTIRFGGQLLKIQSLRLDSIGNLPSGTCWATNVANNTWGNQTDGCIKVSGLVCSTPGQYRLKIIVTAYVGNTAPGLPIGTDAGAAGLYYYVRVKNASDNVERPVDTSGQSANSNVFVPYGYGADCNVGIKDITSNINNLTVVPNPFTNKAVVSFYADKAGVMTERITNMIGSEVYRKATEVRAGENTSLIDRNNLPSGVYFYSISDGKSMMTKRVVIAD